MKDKLTKGQKPERYAEKPGRDVPTPTISPLAVTAEHFTIRLDWEGIIVVDYKTKDATTLMACAQDIYAATYLLMVPRCLDNAPWGLA